MRLVLFCAFLCLKLSLYGQNRCSELNLKAQSEFQNDFLKSKTLAFKALRCAIESDDLANRAEAELHISKTFTYLSLFDSSVYFADLAKQNYLNLKDSLGIAKATQTMATAQLNKADYSAAVRNYEEAIAYYKQLNNLDGQASCTMNTGLVYSYLGDYNIAGEYYFKALDISEKAENKKNIAYSENNIGSVLYSQGKLEEAQLYYESSLAKGIELEDKILMSDCHYFLALIYLDLEQLDLAKTNCQLTIDIDSVQNNQRGLSQKLIVLGDIYIKNGSLFRAKELFQNSYDILKALPKNDQPLSISARKVGEINRILENYKDAEEYLLESVELAKSAQVREPLYLSYLQLSLLYEGKKQFEKAYHYSILYSTEKDAALNEESNRSTNLLSAFYQDEKKRLEIKNLEKESALNLAQLAEEQFEKEQKGQQVTFLLIGISTLIILAIYLFINAKNRRKKNDKLEQQKSLISAQNEEKEILLKEIHHRVKNNLQVIASLLSLQSKTINDPSALDAVQESRNRVGSMALIHQKLYQGENLAAIEMRDYFETIGSTIINSFGAKAQGVELEVNMPEIELDVDTAIPIGLITNELITNSLKYAFQEKEGGKIFISMKKKEDNLIHLQIADNGIHQPIGISEGGTGFGTMLINLLTTQLGGELEQSTTQGTATIIKFRINNKAA